jgi:hypothetical protein
MPIQSASPTRGFRGFPADRREGPTPIAVYPVIEQAETKDRHQTAEQCPSGWQPALQHPANRAAHQRGAQPYFKPGVPGDHLADHEENTLHYRINRAVRRLLIDMKTFEVFPHRMRGIGNASQGEGVGHQQITMFVMYFRRGDWHDR